MSFGFQATMERSMINEVSVDLTLEMA